MLKYKRAIWIALAVVFIVVLLLIKTTSEFVKNNETAQSTQQEGLVYGDEALGDLVSNDADGDGILNWEEGLWGTDPTKKDTDEDGVTDYDEIAQIKKQNQVDVEFTEEPENLTATDKFSRELFSTIVSLNQAGAMDQNTVETLSDSLYQQIQNSAPKKVFLISQIKIIDNDTQQSIQNYAQTLGGTFDKHTINVSILEILSQSLTIDGDVNAAALDKLDPVIAHLQGIIDEMLVMTVPSSISLFHLDTLNAFERLMENLIDIKLVESDELVAISALSQYQKNDDAVRTSIERLKAALN